MPCFPSLPEEKSPAPARKLNFSKYQVPLHRYIALILSPDIA
jgi:hypothetical protein